MNEKKIQVFLDGVTHYFKQLNLEATISTPYIVENHPDTLEYTGIIGVSGERKGAVYFSSTKSLLLKLLTMMGEPDCSDENLIDLVGEIANTIAGNARKEFGKDFDISIPVMIKGTSDIYLPPVERSFVIPIDCLGMKAILVVCIRTLIT